ncbi:MAG: hypothetical protein AB7P97_21875 [Hyphomonadaceae bacterium]
MNVNLLATSIISGVLTLGLIVGTVVLLSAGVDVPDEFVTLLPVGFGAAIGGAAAVSAARNAGN